MADESKPDFGLHSLATGLDEELEKHLNAMLEKNKDYKYESNLTAENVEQVRSFL